MEIKLSDLQKGCLFCEPSNYKQENQVLLKSNNFYIFAGLGPIIEGYLIITPYYCNNGTFRCRSISELSTEMLDELAFLRQLAMNYYIDEYGYPGFSFEHGRAGSCLRAFTETRHCLHAHLCCYPGVKGINDNLLWNKFFLPNKRKIYNINQIPTIAGQLPYIYIEQIENFDTIDKKLYPISHKIIYLLSSEERLESQFLRKMLAQYIGKCELWDWYKYPGFESVNKTIVNFKLWLINNQEKYNIILQNNQVAKINYMDSICTPKNYNVSF
jgi:hypothetical protein